MKILSKLQIVLVATTLLLVLTTASAAAHPFPTTPPITHPDKEHHLPVTPPVKNGHDKDHGNKHEDKHENKTLKHIKFPKFDFKFFNRK